MKKALALVLALVLALSMGVSALAAVLVPLGPDLTIERTEKDVFVVDVLSNPIIHVYEGGTYYIALSDEAWENIKLTANNIVSAELVEYDPTTMNIYGHPANADPSFEIVFDITRKGEAMLNGEWFTSNGVWVDGVAAELQPNQSTDKYFEAVAYAKALNEEGHPAYEPEDEVTYYDVEVRTNVNIIKVTVEDNYGVHYDKGTLKIEATLNGLPFSNVLTVINDVVIFEYEELKWTANNFADLDMPALTVNQKGYSDYIAELIEYDAGDVAYDEQENRLDSGAAVVSTTGFRAIEGKNLRVNYSNTAYAMSVVLKSIEKGQKAVNFQAYATTEYKPNGDYAAINFGFYGDQVVKGEFAIALDTGMDWFQLREKFGRRLEDDDVVIYYLVDENGKEITKVVKDFMTDDVTAPAVFVVEGAGRNLGNYSVVLEVPASEVAGEENPNTGAESVVGVVAALAVVSVATAAAVSLKK